MEVCRDSAEMIRRLIDGEADLVCYPVSNDLIAQGYRLKIYDAYRPQKGVDHLVRWAQGSQIPLRPYFFRGFFWVFRKKVLFLHLKNYDDA